MKSISLALVLSVSVLLFSCNSQTAAKYNNQIVGLETALLPSIESSSTKIDKFAESAEWDSVAAVSKRMEDLVETSIQEITKKNAPDVTGAEDFKKESIRYFKYIKGIYTGYGKLAAQTTDEARLEEYERFAAMVKERDEVLKSYQAAQVRFTKANNVKLESK